MLESVPFKAEMPPSPLTLFSTRSFVLEVELHGTGSLVKGSDISDASVGDILEDIDEGDRDTQSASFDGLSVEFHSLIKKYK